MSNTDSPVPKPALLRWLPLILLAAATVLIFSMGWHKRISLQAIIENEALLRQTIADHWLPALAGFALAYAALVALSLPVGAVLTVTGGYLFGLIPGAAATVTGATIGATLIFMIARSSLGAGLARRAGPAMARFAEGFRADAASYLLFLRLAPIFPFALVNIAPALLGARLQTFVWTTGIGIIPGTLAFTSIGSGLGSVLKPQIEAFRACKAANTSECSLSVDLGSLITKEVLIAFVLLAAVALLPVAIRRFKGGKAA